MIILGIFSNLNDAVVSPRILCQISLSSGQALVCHQGTWNIFWFPGLYPQPLQISAIWESESLERRVDVFLPDRDTLEWVGHFQIIHPFSQVILFLLFPSLLAHIFISFLVHTSKVSFLSCILNGACKLMVLFPDVLPCTIVQCLPLSLLPNHQLLVRITSVWAVKSSLLFVSPCSYISKTEGE